MAASGEEFEDFFREHFPLIRRSLTLIIRDAAVAEESAEEAFARAFVRWRRVRNMERPAAWVMTVALNVSRSAAARSARDRARAARMDVAPNDAIGGALCAIDLQRALDALSHRQRIAVVLRYFADLPVREIAEVMKCAEGTVKSTLHASLGKLRIEFTSAEERL